MEFPANRGTIVIRLNLFPLLLLCSGFLGCDGGAQAISDAGVDAISDAGADAGGLELPFQPPPIAAPLRDAPYLQEFNHTSNEVEAGIGPLVSVRLTPPPLAELGFFDALLQVTPRGFVRHEGDGPAQIISIAPADGNLLAAEFLDDRLVLAGPRHLYFCHDGLNLERTEAPEGVELQGLAPGLGVVYLLCNTGIGDATDPNHVRWPEGGLPVSAALAFNSQLILADSEGIEARSPLLEPTDEAIWRIPLPTGPVVGLLEMRILPLSADLVVVGNEGLAAYDLSGETPRALDVPEFAADRVPLLEPTAAA
ncbi:MAG: hypothetical protein JRF33_26215, partial [Deltaproteobacteria bacterium]|nr:hypothetical protein [Deltaproteobacteria bacterium]